MNNTKCITEEFKSIFGTYKKDVENKIPSSE